MSEDPKRLAVRGQKGDRGEQGKPGLSRLVRRALVFLFALSVILAGANLFWTSHEVRAGQVAIQAAQHREQVLQQQAGAAIGRKLCTTLDRLIALRPPPGPPSQNPSRAYEQELHATLAQLGPDIGCKTGGNS